MRFFQLLAATSLLLLGVAVGPAAAQDAVRPALVARLTGDIINPVSAEYLESAIKEAETQNASCLVVELDTPGGLLTSTRQIVRNILNARVPVVVFVAPRGAQAGSAGLFITLAAHVAAMAPSTNIGAAHPVELGERRPDSDSLEQILARILRREGDGANDKADEGNPPPEPMEQKVLNDTKAWAQAIANERGRNASWAARAVEQSASATADEALGLGIIDLLAEDASALLQALDGREVKLAEGKLTLFTRGATLIDFPKTFRLRWLAAIAHPNIVYILMMLGFCGLLFEFTHPGAGFPGIAGAICLILAFFGMQVLPTNSAGLALIVLAIGLFMAEIKVMSYGLLTIGGLVSLVLGSLILFPSSDEFLRVSLPLVLAVAGATLVIALLLGFAAMRSHRRRIATGAEGLVGATGLIKSWSNGKGKIFIHGELWDASSEEELAPESKAEVVGVHGMRLAVREKRG